MKRKIKTVFVIALICAFTVYGILLADQINTISGIASRRQNSTTWFHNTTAASLTGAPVNNANGIGSFALFIASDDNTTTNFVRARSAAVASRSEQDARGILGVSVCLGSGGACRVIDNGLNLGDGSGTGSSIPTLLYLQDITGTTQFRYKSASAVRNSEANLDTAARVGNGSALATEPFTFSISAAPAAGVQASVNTGGNVNLTRQYVAKTITACLQAPAGGSADNGTIQVLDGATVVWTAYVSVSGANQSQCFHGNVNKVISFNNDVTVRFSAAPAANNLQSVNLSGYVIGAVI